MVDKKENGKKKLVDHLGHSSLCHSIIIPPSKDSNKTHREVNKSIYI